jgi:hypothetical protein
MPNTARELAITIAQVGLKHRSSPSLHEVEAFAHFFRSDGKLDITSLDHREGGCTRRELLLRFLVLSAVLDQGPDIVGVWTLVSQVTNHLYRKEVRFLHQPLLFFRELGIAIDNILEEHKSVKAARAAIWARENQSNAQKYNLFIDNSKQVLNYAIFRWGVPLALPLLLERDEKSEDRKPTALTSHLKSWASAEEMSQQLKDNERYGLGKAVGDKACHLYAKWCVSSLPLLAEDKPNWGPLSYEQPFDSNVGRVLWRTGFLLRFADEKDYVDQEVIKKGKGKGGLHHIRVTNIRGMKCTIPLPSELRDAYTTICLQHLCANSRAPKKIQIQRLPNAYLLAYGNGTSIADFEDGLIHIGTQFCLNHDAPDCPKCPVRGLCAGACGEKHLIADYRT